MTPPAEKQPETDFSALHDNCPFSGQGGSYIVKDGKRELVERTDLDAAAIADANAKADAARAAKKE